MSEDLENGLSGDDKTVREAKKRHEYGMEWEGDFRTSFVQDLKFDAGDPDNHWQWPDTVWLSRTNGQSDQPCLTVNKVRQHNLQIVNDAKQNKPGIIIRPVSDDASYDAAQVYQGIIRHIEYISSAEQAYDTGTTFQVKGGIGYWRVVTEYCDADTFDQEIYIRRIPNPLNVMLDPDISEVDGSDARFGFIWEDMPRDEFERMYGKTEEGYSVSPAVDGDSWSNKNTVRICEYFRKTVKKDKLIMFVDPQTGAQTFSRKSKIGPELWAMVKDEPNSKIRDVEEPVIEWFKIAGSKIVDNGIWPGKYIPIVRVIGEETVIEGRLDRKGHTRALKDAQRTYNYWTSAAVEHVALQGKSPWVAPVEAIEGYEEYYERANTQNLAYLPYKAYADNGQLLGVRPEKAPPPTMAPAFMQGLQITQTEMMMASGQWQAQMGENENAKSGVAINARQRQGDTATYHFIDGLAIAIRFTGKILIDLIPKIYDTERIVHIIADDGEKKQVKVNPQAQQAYQEGAEDGEEKALAIFNPNVGKYEVQSDIGPSYATKRQEAFNAITQIISQNKELATIIGDLLFKNADFPGADVIAERLSRLVPPQALGDQNDPQVMMLTQQLQNAQGIIAQITQKLADKDRELDIKEADAESRRITAIGNSGPAISPEQIAPLVKQLIQEALKSSFGSDEAGEQASTPQG